MYQPLTEALNYALEDLSRIKVDGLPEFETHIVFAVCDKGVLSDRSLRGSSFKPDIAVMSIEDACKFYGLGQLQANESQVSQFVNGAKDKSQSGPLHWNSILSAVEVKRSKASWAQLGKSGPQGQVRAIPDAEERLDEEPDDSQPTPCKTDVFSCGYSLMRVSQRCLRLLWYLLNDPQVSQELTPVPKPRAVSDNVRRRTPAGRPRNPSPSKMPRTRQRNSPIRSPLAMCSTCLSKVSVPYPFTVLPSDQHFQTTACGYLGSTGRGQFSHTALVSLRILFSRSPYSLSSNGSDAVNGGTSPNSPRLTTRSR